VAPNDVIIAIASLSQLLLSVRATSFSSGFELTTCPPVSFSRAAGLQQLGCHVDRELDGGIGTPFFSLM